MEEIKIVDFEEKYADEIDALEAEEWQADGVLDEFNNGSIIRVAIRGNKIIGVIYGEPRGDLFILDVLVIKKEYRNSGLGTKMMNDLLYILKEKNVANILVKALFSNNHINIEGLMRKFEFSEMLRAQGYWGSKYADVWCKVCNSMPCKCTCVFYIKNISYKI